MARGAVLAGAMAALVWSAGLVSAHSPLLACYDNGDGTISCEAGYSDGASAAGQVVRIISSDQRLIAEGAFDEVGTFTFAKPEPGFYVEFEGDASHLATFYEEDLYQ